eukprot:m.74074 g.74074  ORF g.74074 m.74074 type:complete len:677 (-) comp16145_c0_seq1:149-2179(-)
MFVIAIVAFAAAVHHAGTTKESPCDPLVPEVCALPMPSNYFLDSTDCGDESFCESWKDPMVCNDDNMKVCNGFVNLTDALPRDALRSEGINTSAWESLDGFSPLPQITTYFPDLSDATLPKHCPRFWNQNISLSDTSCTVLLDAITGERVAHWIEVDQSFGGDANTRNVLTMWPAARLKGGHRYIVGIHGLTNTSGRLVQPSEYFVAMRRGDERVGTLARRLAMADVFAAIERHGHVGRDTLQVAWDFTVGTRERITQRMLGVRDDALERVGQEGPTYIITSIENYPNNFTARQIKGIMSVPMYLNIRGPNKAARLVVDADGNPVYQGDTYATFEVVIPNSLVGSGRVGRFVQFGHGMFSDKSDVEIEYLAEEADRFGYVLFACDWIGFAAEDQLAIAIILLEDLANFPMIPDRLTQALVHQLCLMRMMTGRFTNEEAFRTVNDQTVLVDPAQRSYLGISMGGIMGGLYMSVSTDVERGALIVPGAPFTMLLPRSTGFQSLGDILLARYPDHADVMAILTALQLLLDRALSEGFLDGLAGGKQPLPNTPPHRVIVQYATGDPLVTWLGAQTMARSIEGMGMFRSNIHIGNQTRFGFNIYEDDDVVTTGSAIVGFDFGAPLDNIPFSNTPCAEATNSHEFPGRNYIAQDMVQRFLTTGEIVNTCGGKCYFPQKFREV